MDYTVRPSYVNKLGAILYHWNEFSLEIHNNILHLQKCLFVNLGYYIYIYIYIVQIGKFSYRATSCVCTAKTSRYVSKVFGYNNYMTMLAMMNAGLEKGADI